MISRLEGVESGDLYTRDGKDVWEVFTYCELPTITMKNIRTGELVGGAVGCRLMAPFEKLFTANKLRDSQATVAVETRQ
jgi:hypothetical protein